jgi:hypothetical protein
MRLAGRLGSERGIALVVALFALIVMSALVSAGFIAGRLEQQSGRNTLFAHQAAEAAEAGLTNALIAISSTGVVLPPVGSTFDLDSLNFSVGFRVERQLSRLTGTLLLIRSTGTRLDADGGALAVRTVGRLLRLASDSLGGPPGILPLEQRGWAQLY